MKEVTNEEELRELVRELLMNDSDLSEFDALYPKRKTWEEESKELRAQMVSLLKHIQNDKYKEGLKSIDSVIYKLKDWKEKIESHLNG